jgi:hypothetical protein
MRCVSAHCLGWGGLKVADAPGSWARNRLVKQDREARFLNRPLLLRAGSNPVRGTNWKVPPTVANRPRKPGVR